MFSKKATKIDKFFTDDLTVTTYCQIDSEDCVNVFGLLRKRELYKNRLLENYMYYIFPFSKTRHDSKMFHRLKFSHLKISA